MMGGSGACRSPRFSSAVFSSIAPACDSAATLRHGPYLGDCSLRVKSDTMWRQLKTKGLRPWQQVFWIFFQDGGNVCGDFGVLTGMRILGREGKEAFQSKWTMSLSEREPLLPSSLKSRRQEQSSTAFLQELPRHSTENSRINRFEGSERLGMNGKANQTISQTDCQIISLQQGPESGSQKLGCCLRTTWA